MAPTCDSFDKRDDAKSVEGAAVATTTATTTTAYFSSDAHDDNGPFYGMFGSREYEPESDWVHSAMVSPRASIPEASETFLRAMKQMGGPEKACECAGKAGHSSGGARPKDSSSASSTVPSSSSSSDKPQKSSKLVKKSASFSVQTLSSSKSSSSSRADDKRKADVASRRMSVPCMRSEKHVQWADEAGVADLVSVRLIRPRIGMGDKDDKHPSPVRSILRRLTGAN